MRILHVGSGFRPWRRGGLVAYVEDLMRAQVARGDEVGYVFSGRQYPVARRPRLRRWTRSDVPLFEIVDSPLYDHGRQPAGEVGDATTERLFEEAVEEFRPDVLHVQEIAGLPSSILDIAHARGVPTVVTLQDYFFVCPVFRLLDAEGRSCLHHEPGLACRAAAMADPRPSGVLVDATIRHDGAERSFMRAWPPEHRDPLLERLGIAVGRCSPGHGPEPGDGEAYRRRRELNVARLNRADRVIAMSHRVADLHAQLGVARDRLEVRHLTLEHIEHLRPREPVPGAPVTFATLAAFESATKGAELLLEAVRLLGDSPARGRFRVLVFGWAEPEYARAASAVEGIEVRRPFAPDELDAMLDQVDVGLMPSTWEEAYGYVGVEFVAKGIPVLANAIGGMTDYVRDGETGWLNHSCSAEELARIMGDIVERPGQVAELNASLRTNRDRLVTPMPRHAEEMDGVYAAVLGERRAA